MKKSEIEKQKLREKFEKEKKKRVKEEEKRKKVEGKMIFIYNKMR